MKALVGFMPDASYDLKSWAVDEERRNVSAYAVFSATHTGEGGALPPTGKSVKTDYVYLMFCGRQNPPHDQDLAFRPRHEGAWLGLASASSCNLTTTLDHQTMTVEIVRHGPKR